MATTIRVSDSVWDLTGEGMEYLLDSTGEVIAVLYEGNFMTGKIELISLDTDTLVVA